MDIDRVSFYPRLVDILEDISQSHFVAFDLELSGVPTKQSRIGQEPGRPSLQRRYEEIKAAAEKYQILQIGLTCVREDLDSGKYICKPYNFEISPLVDEPGLDVERDFAFHTGAVSFLQSVSFDFSKPFTVGVPYLSRDESRQARERHDARQRKDAIADMHIKDTDVEALAFLQRSRNAINRWIDDRSPAAPDHLNIGPQGLETVGQAQPLPEFTRFQKRLVHQLVRAEYPQLVSVGKRASVQIIRFSAEREARVLAERKAELDVRVRKQKGFRWVIEALLGGNISGWDLNLCARDPRTGDAVFADMTDYRSRLHEASYLTRERPRALVGHNCFLDLVYLYRTFLGELPDTAEEFARLLHAHWPVVIDTKYMATQNCGDINPASSLEEIARQLAPSGKREVLDVVDELHTKYKDIESFHEAGFDSLLTAQVAIRLSTKLEVEGAYVNDSDEGGGVSVSSGNAPVRAVNDVVKKGRGVLQAAFGSLGLNGSKRNEAEGSELARNTQGVPSTSGFTPSDPSAKWTDRGDASLGLQSPEDPFKYDPTDRHHRYRPSEAEEKGIEGGMPRFGRDFWRVYGNRLRVFGTEESVLVLDKNIEP